MSYIKDLTVKDLYLTFPDRRIAGFLRMGLAEGNELFVLSTVEELLRRNCDDTLITELRIGAEEGCLNLGDHLTISVGNLLKRNTRTSPIIKRIAAVAANEESKGGPDWVTKIMDDWMTDGGVSGPDWIKQLVDARTAETIDQDGKIAPSDLFDKLLGIEAEIQEEHARMIQGASAEQNAEQNPFK